jgi:mono/diheme cytochrome c family protein
MMRSVILPLILGLAALTPALGAERSAQANFVLRCAGCHALDGSGHPVGGIPDFRGLVGAFAGEEEGRTYLMHVPGVTNASLSDAEIAAVLNYIMDNWAGPSLPSNFKPFDGEEVGRLRAQPIGDVVAYRRQLVQRLTAMGLATADYPWP